MEDWQDDVTLVGFVDDIENAEFYASKHKLGQQVTEGLSAVHDALVDLGQLVQSAEALDTVKNVMGNVVDDLNQSCIAGDERKVLDMIGIAKEAIKSAQLALEK